MKGIIFVPNRLVVFTRKKTMLEVMHQGKRRLPPEDKTKKNSGP